MTLSNHECMLSSGRGVLGLLAFGGEDLELQFVVWAIFRGFWAIILPTWGGLDSGLATQGSANLRTNHMQMLHLKRNLHDRKISTQAVPRITPLLGY